MNCSAEGKYAQAKFISGEMSFPLDDHFATCMHF